MESVNVDAVKAMETIDVVVHYERMTELKARWWIAKRLIRLGFWVANIGVSFEEEAE